MRAKIKANYHWLIAAIALVAMFTCGGIGNSLAGITLIPITESLNVSRGEFSSAMMVRSVSIILMNLFSGTLLVKFGYRKMVTIGLVISTLGYAMAAGSQTLPVMCVAAVMEGAYGLCTNAGNPRLLSSWFHRHYGLVTGVITAMTGLGGSVFSLIFGKIVSNLGWRSAYGITAGIIAAVTVMIAVLVRNKPADMGLKPYGEGYVPKNTKKDTEDHWDGYSFAVLKKKSSFRLMVLGTFLSCFCVYMPFSVLAAHVQDCGMSAEFAAGVQSLLMFMLAAFKLAFGYLSDKVGAKRMSMVSLVAVVAAMLLLAGIKTAGTAYLSAVVYALALPICGIAPMLLVTTLFGYHSSAKAMGIILAMTSLGNMLASPLANLLRDMLGSYRPVFLGTAAVSVGVILLYLVIYKLADKDRKEYERSQQEITA